MPSEPTQGTALFWLAPVAKFKSVMSAVQNVRGTKKKRTTSCVEVLSGVTTTFFLAAVHGVVLHGAVFVVQWILQINVNYLKVVCSVCECCVRALRTDVFTSCGKWQNLKIGCNFSLSPWIKLFALQCLCNLLIPGSQQSHPSCLTRKKPASCAPN